MELQHLRVPSHASKPHSSFGTLIAHISITVTTCQSVQVFVRLSLLVLLNAANKDPRFADWGLDVKTGKLDWDLIRIWSHLATHHTAIVGKAVTKAIHSTTPKYSYLQGTSGGGRQTLVSAQRYPEAYDGMWAADCALNYPKLAVACLWPLVVMKEYDDYLSPTKLSAFRDAAAAALGREHGVVNDHVGVFDTWRFNASQVVGSVTEDGPITETDAAGKQLWGGVPATPETWGQNVHKVGIALTAEEDGRRVPVPFMMSTAIGRWYSGNPNWDWTSITVENFEDFFNRVAERLAEIASADTDLSGLRASGHKLIMSHAVNDEVVMPWSALDYFSGVLAKMGGLEGTSDYVSLFVGAGDAHSNVTKGPGLTLAAGMKALMALVEEGTAPDLIVGEKFDLSVGRITQTRPIHAYPYTPRYNGRGDPLDASSYHKALFPSSSLL